MHIRGLPCCQAEEFSETKHSSASKKGEFSAAVTRTDSLATEAKMYTP